jgi:Putative Ig domain
MRFNFVCARALLTAISVTALATACGGGGGDGSTGQQTSPPPSNPGSTNHAPTISGTAPTSATVGTAYSFTPSATDPDGDALTYSVANQPAWLTINSATGKLSGTPTATGTFANIMISVSDGKGGTASLTGFSVAVASATPPSTGTGAVTLNWAAPTQNTDGTGLTDLSSYKIVYGRDAGSLTQSKSIPSTVNSAVIDNLASGTWFFAIVSVTASGTESAPTNVASANI